MSNYMDEYTQKLEEAADEINRLRDENQKLRRERDEARLERENARASAQRFETERDEARAEADSLRRFAFLVEESSLDDPEHIVDACDAVLGGQFDDWAIDHAPEYAPTESDNDTR